MCTALEESLLQSFFVKTISDSVVRHSLAYLSIFARIASAITASEKS